jgi:thiol-disulfide isomerase/thioredoxin
MIPAHLRSSAARAASTAIGFGLAIALGAGCGASTTSASSPSSPASSASAPAAKASTAAAPTRAVTGSRPTTASKAPAKTVQLNAPGAAVDVLAALPAGYVTVVDFWSVSCEACIVQGEKLAAGVAEEPRVLIRKVDVGDGDTPVAAAYKIAVLPHFFIYDKQKRLRYDLLGPDCSEAAKYARQLAAE